MNPFAIAIFVLALSSVSLFGEFGTATNEVEPYISRIWQTDDGLPQNDVQSLAQTRDGYLWLGTQQDIARFDGVRFMVIEPTLFPDVENRAAALLCVDRDGTLWLATADGKLRFWKGDKIGEIHLPETVTNSFLTRILPARDGSLWIGTHVDGLLHFKDGKFEQWNVKEGLAHSSIRSICEDAEGTIWIGTAAGLNRVQGDKITTLTTQNGLLHNSIRVVYSDQSGNLWVASQFGLSRLKDGKAMHFTKREGLADNLVTAIFEDRRGTIWVGTLNGLNRFVNGTWLEEARSDGTSYGRINCIFEDREDNLWIGSREGLSRLKPRAVTSLTKQQGLTHDTVTSVLQDRDGNMWIGFWGGGLNKIEHGKVTAYTTHEGMSSDLVLTIHQARPGGIWFGMDYDGGMNRWDNGKFMHYRELEGLKDWGVKVFQDDRRGYLWIGTRTALLRFKDGKFAHFTMHDGLPSETIEAIHEDRAGRVWFGTTGGLAVWQDGKFAAFTDADGLPHNFISAIHEDREGTLWLGTHGGGLVRMKSDGLESQEGKAISVMHRSGFKSRESLFTSYTTGQGLFHDEIFGELEDDFGFLWLSSPQGIFRVKKKDLEDFVPGKSAPLVCVTFGKADGMASMECKGSDKTAACKSADGLLWFATAKGVAVIDPARVQVNSTPPPVEIEEIIADQKPLGDSTAPRSNAMMSSRSFSDLHLHQFTIPPGRGELEFHYTALSLQAPEKNRFKYKLEGIDADWLDAGTRRVAYYNNLRPGIYNLRVIACNNDGVWNETGSIATVNLLPHFWQTWWFYSLVGFVSFSSVAGSVRYATWKRVQKKLLRLEQQHAVERERIRIAQDMHDDLGARLTEILMLSNLTAIGRGGEKEMKATAGKVVAATEDLVRNLDGIVWVVNPRNDSLENLALYFYEYVQRFFSATNIRCRWDVPQELPSIPLSAEVRHNLFLVFKEALNNVVKHSGATEVNLQLQLAGNVLSLSIRDNGNGFAAGTLEPCGNGLINMRKRIESIGGKCEVESAPGKGTRIRFTLAIRQ